VGSERLTTSPLRPLLAVNRQKPSSWVRITAPWYKARAGPRNRHPTAPLSTAAGWTDRPAPRYGRAMGITATIMNTVTGRPIQKMTFGRMPKPWASFTLETGELVTAERIDIGKPAPGKVVTPVDVWITLKPKE